MGSVSPFGARASAAPRDQLRILAEGGPNSRDPQGDGAANPSFGTFTNVYDRLINFDRTEISPGVYKYDYHRFKGELAASYEAIDGGKSLLFHLRPDATFHDGSPVTAEDVRYSLSRAVSMPTSKRQLSTGSLTDPKQFVAVDAHTFRIDFSRPDRYTLPNLALTGASILNARLVQSHATAADPWAADWLRTNTAGGGAYTVESWQAGQQVVYRRFEAWKSGPLPAITRAVLSVVPDADSRMAALARGDADIVLQIPPKDVDGLLKNPAVHLVDLPVSTAFRFIAFNTQTAPFNDVRVRQAIAHALPYADLFQAAAYGHGQPLWGAASAEPATSQFPQPYPTGTDLARAKALLAEVGLAGGFKTTFSLNAADATIAEPIALLVQQALAPLGIAVEIDKVAAADWGTRLTKKSVPFYVEWSSAWFNEPDYFFRIFFEGDWRWNFGSFTNPELSALVDAARWETDPTAYDAAIRKAITIAFRDLPIVPLWLPSFEAALNPALRDFTYYIHGQVDLRPLTWA